MQFLVWIFCGLIMALLISKFVKRYQKLLAADIIVGVMGAVSFGFLCVVVQDFCYSYSSRNGEFHKAKLRSLNRQPESNSELVKQAIHRGFLVARHGYVLVSLSFDPRQRQWAEFGINCLVSLFGAACVLLVRQKLAGPT